MARIAGVDIPRNKHIGISLQYIYGVGPSLSRKVLDQAGINPDTRTEELTEEEVKALRKELNQLKKDLKAAQGNLLAQLEAVHVEMSADDCRHLVLDTFRDDLAAELERYVTAHRARVVGAVENWSDKYRVTLRDIDDRRDGLVGRLREFMGELGYGD